MEKKKKKKQKQKTKNKKKSIFRTFFLLYHSNFFC